jgi:hypothetical protein
MLVLQALYPGVPVELVVSIGTGSKQHRYSMQSMGWDVLVNQLVASSTDTEDVHAVLKDLLPHNVYHRFNPTLNEELRIDEKNKHKLSRLKIQAKKHIENIEYGQEAKDFRHLIKTLQV